MGWGRTFLLGDIGNRLDIEDVEEEVRRLKLKIEANTDNGVDLEVAIERLIYENAELKIYLSALLRILTEKSILTVEELDGMVARIDKEDGNEDGKFDGSISPQGP